MCFLPLSPGVSAISVSYTHLMIGKGPSAQSSRINLPRFTLVGATTRAGPVSYTHLDVYKRQLVHREVQFAQGLQQLLDGIREHDGAGGCLLYTSRILHLGFFLLEGIQLLLHPKILGNDRVGQIAAGAGFVQQVDAEMFCDRRVQKFGNAAYHFHIFS